MPFDLSSKDWLIQLVEDQLGRHEPSASAARLPPEAIAAAAGRDLAPGVRLLVTRSLRQRPPDSTDEPPKAIFLGEVRGHVDLVLDVALLAGRPRRRDRELAELAASLAGALDEPWLALAVEASSDPGGAPADLAAALRAAGRALKDRFFPPGDPLAGLPLYPGVRASFRRQLARVAMGLHRTGRLTSEALDRHRTFAEEERALLAEGLAGLVLAAAPTPDEPLALLRRRQLGRLGLSGPRLRDARHAVASPRPAGVLALATPPLMRPFLLEQLLLAQRRAALPVQPAAGFIEAYGAAAGLDAPALVAAQVEAAAQLDDHLAWFKGVAGPGADWPQLAVTWEEAADEVMERVGDAVSTNYDTLTMALRETGELGQLLGRAATGATLTAEEKRKVKEQLVDLAKAVPALAIFAAPGGMLLLPLLARLLPFSLMPGAWERARERSRQARHR